LAFAVKARGDAVHDDRLRTLCLRLSVWPGGG